jgi:hypothetical protein
MFVLSIINVDGQTPTPTPPNPVIVDQSFVDSANQAFELIVELRDVVENFKIERAKNKAEREASDALILGLNQLVNVKDRVIATQNDIIVLYEKVIRLQGEIIEKLTTQLNKKPSFLDKALRVLKEVALLAGGIVLGRGL